jgi:hypothetical protein
MTTCKHCGQPTGTGTLYDFKRASLAVDTPPGFRGTPEQWKEWASRYACPGCKA